MSDKNRMLALADVLERRNAEKQASKGNGLQRLFAKELPLVLKALRNFEEKENDLEARSGI